MKKSKYISLFIPLAIFIISCNSKSRETYIDTTFVQNETVEVPVAMYTTAKISTCYLGIIKKDTVSLKLSIFGDSVKGNLTYHYYEKDSNIGIISGRLASDTLFAKYKFRSEGVESEREVVFLTKNNIVKEGYGDVEEKNGVVVFKDKSKLNFSKSLALQNVECE
jgi:hypothetical protein